MSLATNATNRDVRMDPLACRTPFALHSGCSRFEPGPPLTWRTWRSWRENLFILRILASQERVHFLRERFELIVMNPVAGLRKGDDTRVSKMFRPPVLLGIRRPAGVTVDEKSRALDRAPQTFEI